MTQIILFLLQAARRRVVATLQSIIMYEFLPAFVGREAADYDGYKSFVHPGISHVFQSAAFRSVQNSYSVSIVS